MGLHHCQPLPFLKAIMKRQCHLVLGRLLSTSLPVSKIFPGSFWAIGNSSVLHPFYSLRSPSLLVLWWCCECYFDSLGRFWLSLLAIHRIGLQNCFGVLKPGSFYRKLNLVLKWGAWKQVPAAIADRGSKLAINLLDCFEPQTMGV